MFKFVIGKWLWSYRNKSCSKLGHIYFHSSKIDAKMAAKIAYFQ